MAYIDPRRGGKPRMPPDPRRARPIQAEHPGGSWFWRLFLIGLLGAGLYGGYYGLSAYKAADKAHRFSMAFQGLHQRLLALESAVTAADVREAVEHYAAESGVEVIELKVVIEPLTSANQSKLPSTAQMGLNIAAKLPRHRKPRWLVGFEGRFLARHGPAERIVEAKRYTWFDGEDVEPGTE